MRLDAVSTPQISPDVKIQPSKGGEITLTEGEVTRARVIAAHDDVVSLKTPDGAVFRARLESGVVLPVGSEARLVVTGRVGDTIVMSLADPASGAAFAAEQQLQLDPAVRAVLLRLAQMGVSFGTDPSTISSVRETLAALPGMSADEAAFFTAHKLPPDGALLDALRAALSGKSDVGALLEDLGRLAQNAAREAAPPGAEALRPEAGKQAAGTEKQLMPETAKPLIPGANPEKPVAGTEKQTMPETAKQVVTGLEKQVVSGADKQAAPGPLKPPAFTQWLARALGSAGNLTGLSGPDLARAPALEALPARSLAIMAESLQNIARAMPELPGEAELFKSIAKFSEELFLRPESPAGEAAAKLKAAREELYIKLAYFKDAVAMSSAPSKGLMLEQTQKLLDHARLMGGLDQFAYVSLPIRLGDERSRAELYVYKREKGGVKRIDPEDVRILLVLDTERLGRLETFVEIKGRDVSLRFEVESENVASVIRQNTTKLHKLLDESGYKYANSNIITKKSETTIESALISLRSYDMSKSGGLDFTV